MSGGPSPAGGACSRGRPPGATRTPPLLAARLGTWAATVRADGGQAAVLLTGGLLAVALGAAVLAAVAHGIGAGGDRQRAADLAALAGARAMRADYSRLFEPVALGGRPNPRHLGRVTYLARGRSAAVRAGRLNAATRVSVAFPDGATIAPVRIRVTVGDPVRVDAGGRERAVAHRAVAEAELAPPGGAPGLPAGAGEYRGPLAMRQGKPMRPDVARAFDRLDAAARADGVSLIISSAFRTNAEQAELFAAHPDPKWVAPPGHSLHRLGTELDLGPRSAYGWLAAHAGAFHFVQRYSWEPWHYGFTLNAGTGSVGFGGDGAAGRTLPSFVPAAYAGVLARAATRWNVSAALLAAQLYAESGFNPFATSGAGAQGIAQFMPGTAAAMGLDDPFDAPAAIDAQAHLMRDLLRQFGSVPLALAAYNAGPAPVHACGCVPDNGETAGYVARILGLLGGAGDPSGAAGLVVRLVR
jgi:Transglycosylase SLT domain/D-alanyl-D-alanine carboxypeptidase